ncbi:MAG TPA: TIGR00645 family protein, partial [Methylophilaceae bacterium]|nr:TIGR00645 family protein [Methylophilaceae bacterium]
FGSRWLQLPLYLGLIVAQAVYVYHFMMELLHLVQGIASLNEEHIMLVVLGLIDVVMISNLLIMVIVGGYETFVSRLNLKGHPDEPDWLSHVNANLLKVKLATAIIGISSIHLLKTFINAANLEPKVLIWQTVIHITFVLSAISIAWIDRLMVHPDQKH